MSSFLYSLGRKAFAARKMVLAVWLVALALAGGAAGLLNKGLDNSLSIPGTESQQALDRLAVTFPQTSGASAQIVVVVPHDVHDPAVQREVDRAVDELEHSGQVAQVVSPYQGNIGGIVSRDDRAGLISIQLDGQNSEISQSTKDRIGDITHDLQEHLPAGSQAAYGGPLFAQKMPSISAVDALGLAVAVVILLITLGSFVAAGMPLLNALAGVGVSMALLFASTAIAPLSSSSPLLALMLGLAVGIDYALFIVSRHQQELSRGASPEESAARAVATAGSAVIFAGLTVMIALLGLGVVGIPFLTTMGIAATVAVGIAVLVSLTLVPALMGFAGSRLRPRGRPARQAKPAALAGTRFFSRWVRAVTRFPILTVLAVLAALGLATVPAAGLRLALPDAGSLPRNDPARVTYDLISEHFSPGYNGPLIVTADIVTSTDPLGLMNHLKSDIERLPGVAAVPLAVPNPTAETGIVQVIPQGGPDSEQTKQLVSEIRALRGHFHDAYGVDVAVTGSTALGIDVSDKLGAAMVPFGTVVVGLSLVLLMIVFRSIAVPIKAALGYLLSVGSSLGVVTLVFQNGWLAGLLNIDRPGPVNSFIPIVLMGVLFGLAMDYEVFLVSRMREEFVHSHDARDAVATGFVSSARVVTAAALIMFAVFVAFVPESDVNIKPLAFGFAVGVFVDAFIVRMTLVPAVLALLGSRAWWIPRRLDRVLPSLDIEGEELRNQMRLADWPRPDSDEAIACEGVRLADPASGHPIYHDVTLFVPRQGTHVVRGPREPAVRALLLTLSGRLKPDAGKLKVLGYVLPARSAAVRSRVAYLDLAEDGAEAVHRALAEDPAMLVLDRADRVSDPDERRRIRRQLAGTRATVLAGTTAYADVPGILPRTTTTTVTELPADTDIRSGLLAGAIR